MRAFTVDGPRSRPRVRDVSEPALGPGRLLVDVRTSAVSGLDVAIAEGRLLERADHVFPVTLGRGFAGTVAEVGDGVEGWAAGDRALGLILGDVVEHGAWAERIVVPADDRVARIPDGVEDETAGAVAFAGVVAMNLVTAARAGDGHEVLVDGDLLGLAPLVVALTAARGARVIATGVAADDELLRAQGAGEVLDPGEDLVAALRELRPDGVDGLIDLVDRGHDGFRDALGVLREGGFAVSAFGAATGSGRPDVDVSNILLEPVPGQLDELVALVADGRLRVPIGATLDLAALEDDLGAPEGTPRGVVVVAIAG